MPGIRTRSEGPLDAQIMLVGEAAGEEEEHRGTPFCGSTGAELNNMLHEAGIIRTECFLTNVCKYRPPRHPFTGKNNCIELFFEDPTKCMRPGPEIREGLEELYKEIELVKPNVIVAFGNVAIWAFRGHRNITDWRGSSLTATGIPFSGKTFSRPFTVVPAIHPTSIFHDWAQRAFVVHDLRKAKRLSESPTFERPAYEFTIQPTLEQVTHFLDEGI